MLNVRDRMDKLVDEMFSRGRTFYGEPLSASLRKLLDVQGGATHGVIFAPYWFPVVQQGRGPRRRAKTSWMNFRGARMSRFQVAIYNWLDKRNMFESQTDKGRINEAKGLAWYINQHGTRHYREGQYIDIYDTLITELVEDLTAVMGREALKITSDIIKLEI